MLEQADIKTGDPRIKQCTEFEPVLSPLFEPY